MTASGTLAAVLAVALLLVIPGSARAASLEEQIEAHTGIVRAVSPTLQEHAAIRAKQVATDGYLSHDGMFAYAEILAEGDPATAVARWHASPDHEPFMHEARYTEIGCGTATVAGYTVSVCSFAPYVADPGAYTDQAVEPVGASPAPNRTAVGSTPTGGATLPNTATEQVSREQQLAIMEDFLGVATAVIMLITCLALWFIREAYFEGYRDGKQG